MQSSPARNKNNISLLVIFSDGTKSSPSTCLLSPNQSSATKSMEDVWNHITLTDPPTPAAAAAATSAFPSAILQDFLSVPFNSDHAPRTGDSTKPSIGGRTDPYASLAPPPTTALSLNSGLEFQFSYRPSSGPSVLASVTKKRARENGDSSSVERHKRMMKNRESAARSRARKQAYTYELEFAVSHLKEENARLRMQQSKLLAASERQAQPPKRQSLYRTLTAPF